MHDSDAFTRRCMLRLSVYLPVPISMLSSACSDCLSVKTAVNARRGLHEQPSLSLLVSRQSVASSQSCVPKSVSMPNIACIDCVLLSDDADARLCIHFLFVSSIKVNGEARHDVYSENNFHQGILVGRTHAVSRLHAGTHTAQEVFDRMWTLPDFVVARML